MNHQELVGALKSLDSEKYVKLEQASRSWLEATKEGKEIIENGSPEYKVYLQVKNGETEFDKVGFANAMKEKWITRLNGVVSIAKETEDETRKSLRELKDDKNLLRRKLLVRRTLTYYQVEKGENYAPTRVKKRADLTQDLLKGGWATAHFKPYNFHTFGEKVAGGYIQPLLKVRAEFRAILMQMGFEEMPTNRWVESSFWNFDALFQPQSHPARDAHDTFFVAGESTFPMEYYARVKEMHEKGGGGSIGHRSPFDENETKKNLLRTHTTAVSARMLYSLKPFRPVKYFSIDRVFRNESMDSTHLCEFHQVEGLVADYDLSLANLISIIRTFFAKIGITQLRFKPAFNPYTEPSMEVFGYHPDLKKWTEIGNSGIFRPEMLQPMGLPENVRVIAWGLSLERPTMIKYRISNIRDLFGHKADLARTKKAPMCIFP